MAYPDLKCSEAKRRGVSHEARNTTWLLFWVDKHSEAMSKGITQKAMDKGCASAASQQQGAHREQAVFALAAVHWKNAVATGL